MKALDVLEDIPTLAGRFSEADPGIENEAVPFDPSSIELRQTFFGPSDQELRRVTIGRNGLSLHDRDREAMHEHEWDVGTLGDLQHLGAAEPGHVVQDIHADLQDRFDGRRITGIDADAERPSTSGQLNPVTSLRISTPTSSADLTVEGFRESMLIWKGSRRPGGRNSP